MIVVKQWEKRSRRGGRPAQVTQEGWFLLGFILLFARDLRVVYY